MFVILILFLFCTNCSERREEIRKNKNNVFANSEIARHSKDSVIITPKFRIKVHRTIPHDSLAFTQGLFFYNGYLYESTGQYGKSSLRRIDSKTGKILKSILIGNEYFAEGIALFHGKIYMLTWQNELCLVFDVDTFEEIDTFFYSGEGWGLTNFDENFFVQSDGTNALRIIDPNGFKIVSTLFVTDAGHPVSNINELEIIGNEIWANIWMKDIIAVIDKTNGKVKYWVDISSLRSYIRDGTNIDALNGIAYDKESGRIYLTGKYWPYIFEVEVID